jgi:hypothetical protein
VTDHVLMVRPRAFGPNSETAASNAFQDPISEPAGAVHERALREFESARQALSAAGVFVEVIEDTAAPAKPDAIFPNNWFSTHDDGTVVVYPLTSPLRRAERRPDVLAHLSRRFGFTGKRLIDLTSLEDDGLYLEGTGSLVLDRTRRVAFACLSPRTTEGALQEFSRQTAFEVVPFHACDEKGVAIYHTNVMMSLGENFALACLDAIRDARERQMIESRLRAHNDLVLEISLAQMRRFAGNILELSTAGRNLLALSTRALSALGNEQRSLLEQRVQLLALPVPTIENVGGGGVRCMLAELFLPRMPT